MYEHNNESPKSQWLTTTFLVVAIPFLAYKGCKHISGSIDERVNDSFGFNEIGAQKTEQDKIHRDMGMRTRQRNNPPLARSTPQNKNSSDNQKTDFTLAR